MNSKPATRAPEAEPEAATGCRARPEPRADAWAAEQSDARLLRRRPAEAGLARREGGRPPGGGARRAVTGSPRLPRPLPRSAASRIVPASQAAAAAAADPRRLPSRLEALRGARPRAEQRGAWTVASERGQHLITPPRGFPRAELLEHERGAAACLTVCWTMLTLLVLLGQLPRVTVAFPHCTRRPQEPRHAGENEASSLVIIMNVITCASWKDGIQGVQNLAWTCCEIPVFTSKEEASLFIHRRLLYNRFDLELFTPGDLERECMEELCNYEEAREIFVDEDKTMKFWQDYSTKGPTTKTDENREKIDVMGILTGLIAAGVFLVIFGLLGYYLCITKCNRQQHLGSPTAYVRRDRHAPTIIFRRPEEALLNIPSPSVEDSGLPSYEQAVALTRKHNASPPPPYPGPAKEFRVFKKSMSLPSH